MRSASRKSRREPRRAGELALTPTEVERLLAAVDRTDDDALLRLAVSTGIRREDLVAIERASVDLGADIGWVSYFESKKARERRVPVGGSTLLAVRRQLNALRGVRTKWLFPSRRGARGHVSGRCAWTILHRHLARAGLGPRPFHALRGTAVKLAQSRGWSIEQIAELTGDSVRTIQTHYSVPSRDEMTEVARSHPLI
jgi:integrase